MKSLALKLTLAFLFVGLIGAALIALTIRQRTQTEFNRFMQNRDMTALANTLGTYYQFYGRWEGVEQVLRSRIPENMRGPGGGMGRNFRDPGMNFILATNNGTIIFSPIPKNIGKTIPRKDLDNATPILVESEIVGWVMPGSIADFRGGATAEGIFLANINQAILFSALAATVVALALGGFLAYTLTRDLRKLTEATQHVAQGDLGYQVDISSADELGELATSFNRMSTDLGKSNRLRQQMTANIAHDLRSPLAVILGYTEALNDGKLIPSDEIFNTMHIEASHLNHLIDDLKMLSLADAGELPLTIQPISPETLLRRVENAYRIQAEHKQIILKVDAEQGLPEINIDAERMVQVFSNLMNNAIRHTPKGGRIVLSAKKLADKIDLRVADNGEGISADELPVVFERTYRGDKSRQHNDNATGLGLAIARSLVEAQGGSISATSKSGEGTSLSIQLPIV